MSARLALHAILAMGLLSFLTGCKPKAQLPATGFQVDLGKFACGQTALGVKPGLGETYAGQFNSEGVANFGSSGVELGLKGEVLDYLFITMTNFAGTILKDGAKISVSTNTTPEQIIALFGEPYWKDVDDDESILFYEYQNGKVEVQFEFPDKRRLGFITMSRNGVLSDAKQRNAYRVTKEWPPK
jgi:hypothetical protein